MKKNIEIEFTYDKGEVVEMVLANHTTTQGNAPEGYKWAGKLNYSDEVVVSAEKLPEAQPKKEGAA